MNALDTSAWARFPLIELFDIDMGSGLDFGKMTLADADDQTALSFVGRTASNNGVMGLVTAVQGAKTYDAGAITVALGGSIGASFVQHRSFHTSQNVAVLTAKIEIENAAKMFVCSVILKESTLNYRAFVRELNVHLRKDFEIPLPISASGTPDWPYMARRMRSLCAERESALNNIVAASRVPQAEVNTREWTKFRIGDLFPDIQRAKRRTLNDYSPGDTPYVTNSASNNGISGYLTPKTEDDIERGKCITVNSVDGSAFWQERDFLANSSGNGLLLLRNLNLNMPRALFVCAVIQATLDAGFSVMLTLETLRDTYISLPADPSGQPDWRSMESTLNSALSNVAGNLAALTSVDAV